MKVGNNTTTQVGEFSFEFIIFTTKPRLDEYTMKQNKQVEILNINTQNHKNGVLIIAIPKGEAAKVEAAKQIAIK